MKIGYKMRPKERIPIFLELVDREELAQRWTSSNGYISPLTGEEDEWLKVPDQRYGQFLINQGLLPDNFKIWNDEEHDILYDQGVNPREFFFWTSLFDKEGNKLEEPITKLIKDLDTEHIKKILKSEFLHLNDEYKEIFNNELKLRNENMGNK